MSYMTDLIYKRDKTKNDIDLLLKQHKNLIYYMLSLHNQLANQDAESAAWEALWDAICTFDIFSKVPFSSYACVVIKNAINDVLRKQIKVNEKQKVVIEDLDELNMFSMLELNDTGLKKIINDEFEKFIASRKGKIRDVMLVWYSYDFCTTVQNIADKCGCTASYVSRVQTTFRAILSAKVKDF